MALADVVYVAPLITAGIALGSVLVASFWAFLNIRTNRRIARDRAAIDVIFKREWDARYQQHKAAFNRLRDQDGGIAASLHKDKPDPEDVTVIRSILNDYELIALSIARGVIEEGFYKRWFRGSMIQDFISVEGTILWLRDKTNNPKLYIEWERLARRWMAE